LVLQFFALEKEKKNLSFDFVSPTVPENVSSGLCLPVIFTQSAWGMWAISDVFSLGYCLALED